MHIIKMGILSSFPSLDPKAPSPPVAEKPTFYSPWILAVLLILIAAGYFLYKK